MKTETVTQKNEIFSDILENPHDFKHDWNKLMMVVEKIETIHDKHHGYFGVFISSNSCTIQGTNLRLDKPTVTPAIYYNSIALDTKLNATYHCVLMFIKWYNTGIR